MKVRSFAIITLLASWLAACRGGTTTAQSDGSASGSGASPRVSPPPLTTTTPMTTPIGVRGDAGPGACFGDADCAAGLHCFFRDAGCSAPGKCLASDGPRNCAAAVPMCSCTRKVTFFGSGGCAGSGVREAWELYACPCAVDADCRGGQRCVAKKVGLSRPDTERECRDAKP